MQPPIVAHELHMLPQRARAQAFRCSGVLAHWVPPIVLVLGVPVFQGSCIMVTRYKRVSWHAQKKQWVAQVVAAGKRKKVKALYKYFNSETAAADAVQQFLGLTGKADMIALLDL